MENTALDYDKIKRPYTLRGPQGLSVKFVFSKLGFPMMSHTQFGVSCLVQISFLKVFPDSSIKKFFLDAPYAHKKREKITRWTD